MTVEVPTLRTFKWAVQSDAFADLVGSLRYYLLLDGPVSAAVGTRVFGEELPESEINNMPRPCTVLRSSGGPGMGGYARIGNYRVDVRCYGETPYRAKQVWFAVYNALKHMPRTNSNGVLVHSARPEVMPIHMREPDTDWPLTFGSFLVLAAEARLT